MTSSGQPDGPHIGEVTATVIVDAPAARVFAALSDWEQQSAWIPRTQVRVVEGDGGEGSRIEAVTVVGPLKLRDEMRVTRLDAPYEIAVMHFGQVLTGPGVMRCTPMGPRPDPGGLARVVPAATQRRGRSVRLAGGALARLEDHPDPGVEALRAPGGAGPAALIGVP